ncbi:MAG TPA: hypothetical protein VNZ45_05110 [Bacteroidia bacterium]|nr:hypothetical protein [Bacteroidia bacterium]
MANGKSVQQTPPTDLLTLEPSPDQTVLTDEIMEAEQQESVEEITAEPEVVEEQEAPKPQVPSYDQDEADRNFKAMREAKAQAQRERDELARQLEDLKAAREEELSIGDDELAEGKHLKKQNDRIRKLEAKIIETEKRNNDLLMESKLKSKYPDFDEVVNESSLSQLSKSDPDTADSIRILAKSNEYLAAVNAYKALKKDSSPLSVLTQDQQKALKNAAKPRPSVSISPTQGESPLTRANAFAQGLTPELKAQLAAEMQEMRRKS